MRRVSTILIFLSVVACDSNQIADSHGTHVSKSQAWLNKTFDSLQAEFSRTDNELKKKEISAEYKKKIDQFFTDSCDRRIDSIEVNVQEIKPLTDELIATTFRDKFHARFKYDFNFKTKPTDKDSMYRFLKGLPNLADTNISFLYLDCDLNDPSNQYLPTLDFEAIPVPNNMKASKQILKN